MNLQHLPGVPFEDEAPSGAGVLYLHSGMVDMPIVFVCVDSIIIQTG